VPPVAPMGTPVYSLLGWYGGTRGAGYSGSGDKGLGVLERGRET
jgi:hypothetical protein